MQKFIEGHSSVVSTQRERDQKFYRVNTSQQQQQYQQQQQQIQPQSIPKRSTSGSSNGSNDSDGTNGSNGSKPPQLPPRETGIYSHELPTVSLNSFRFFLVFHYYLTIETKPYEKMINVWISSGVIGNIINIMFRIQSITW